MSENDIALSGDMSGGGDSDIANLEAEAQALMNADGYSDDSMKQNNPTAYEKHQEATHAAYERLGAALDEREHKAEGLEAKAIELMQTPGYSDGSLKNSNPLKYKQLTDEITALYNQARPNDQHLSGPMEKRQTAAAQEATALIESATKELAALKDLGFEIGPTPKTIMPYHVEGWTQQRLLAQGNYDELAPLVSQDLRNLQQSSEAVNAFDTFMRIPDFDETVREQISEIVIRFLYEAKRTKG